MDLSLYRRKVDLLLADYEHARRVCKEEKQNLREANENLLAAQEAQKLLQEIAQKVQEHAHSQIASVVSRCLEAVYGEEAYRFKIDFQKKRGRTEAILSFVCGDSVYSDPTNESSGGQMLLAAFALRVASLVLEFPQKRRFLALDEPFRDLDRGAREKIGVLLETLAKELGFQFLLTTHDLTISVGKEVELW